MKTQAAVVRPHTNHFEFEEVQLDAPRAHEAIVRVVAAGLCKTDLAARDGRTAFPLPGVLGHEGVAVVLEVGREVRGVVPGDAVMLSFTSCGTCRSCVRKAPAYCSVFGPINFSGRRPDGTTPLRDAHGDPLGGRFFGQSCHSQYALVDERSMVRVEVESEGELARLAPIGCAIQTGVGTVLNELRPSHGDNVVIFGAGSVGLAAVMACKLTDASQVIVVDPVPERLELARSLGATHVLDARNADCVAEIIDMTDGGADCVVEATGVPSVLRSAVDCTSSVGVVAAVGSPPPGSEVSLDINLLKRGRTVKGVTEGGASPADFLPRLVDLYRRGELPFDLFSQHYKADQINQAAADAEQGRCVKPIISFGDA